MANRTGLRPSVVLGGTLLLVGMLVLASCGDDESSTNGADGADPEADTPTSSAAEATGIAADLADARQRWAANGISTYRYETFIGAENETASELRCGTHGRLTVQVVDGTATEARDGFSGCVVNLDNPDRPPLTVEEWFALIESVAAEPNSDLHVTFSDITGVPTWIVAATDTTSMEAGIQDMTEGIIDRHATEDVLANLDDARGRWNESDLTSYRYQIEVRCFCPDGRRGPFDVVVEDGVIAEALWNGKPPADFVPDEFFTVPGLFATVEQYAYSDSIAVTYHPELGYPMIIDADPVLAASDEEQTFVVSDLEALED